MPRLHNFVVAFTVALGIARPAAADLTYPLPLPGGVAAVAKLAGITDRVEPGRAIAVIARALHATPPDINTDVDARLHRLLDAFATVSAFETRLKAIQPDGGGIALALAADQAGRRRLDDLLQYVDFTIRDRSGRLTVEARNNRDAALRAQTLAAFGVNLTSLAERLNRGETARLQVTREDVAVPLSPETWARLIFERSIDARWLAAEILTNRQTALLAYGLLSLDKSTSEYMATHPALVRRIHDQHASVFAGFGAGLRIENGRVLTPGGQAATSLWEWAVDAKATEPDAFVRALYASSGGRLAYVYDILAHLDAPHQAFAVGTWMTDPRTQRDRFRSFLTSGMILTDTWEPAQFPFMRPSYDAALLLATVAVRSDGAPAPPASARLWRLALEADDLPSEPGRDLRNPESEGTFDAAWLVEQASLFDPADRARRLHQVAFGQRVFADATGADLPDILTALASYPPFSPVFHVLERTGIRAPQVYAATARRARGLSDLTGRRAFVALGQYQGAIALIARLSRVGAIAPGRAEQLAASLAAVSHQDGRYRGALVNWMSSELLPSLGDDARTEADVLNAAAGLLTRRIPTPITWEGQEREVWLSAAEGERLVRIRQQQVGVRLDQILAVYNQVFALTRPNLTLPDVGLAASALATISAEWPVRGKDATRKIPGVSPPSKPARDILVQVSGELSRLSKPDDMRKVPRAIEPLSDLLDEALAEWLLSLAYAFDLPEAAAPELIAANPALEHDFGLNEAGWLRHYSRWTEARESAVPGQPWRIAGSIFGLDLAAARYHMRAIAGTPRPGAGVDTPDGDALLRSLARLDPFALGSDDLAALARAISAGRTRVKALLSNPDGLDSIVSELGIDPLRERAIRWDLVKSPDRVGTAFTMTELVALGGGAPVGVSPWGAASTTGCPCSALLGPDAAPALAGRSESRLMPLIGVSDLHLRVVEILHELGLPADLAKATLTYAVRDFVRDPAPIDPDNWLARAQRAQAVSPERVAGYVSALLQAPDSRAQIATRD